MSLPSALKKISSLRNSNVLRLCTTTMRRNFVRRLCNPAQRQSRNKFSSEAQGLGVSSPPVSSSSSSPSSFMRWAPRSVWGLYAVVTTTGVYLLASDIYRVWELSTRVDEWKDNRTSAAEDRLDFVQGSSGTSAQPHVSSSFSNIATLQQLLPSKNISLKGSYSDLPGKRFFYLSKGGMRYDLRFGHVEVGGDEGGKKELLCHFEGKGQDAEGVFTVEGGVCNLANGRLAWGERSRPQPVRYLFSQEDFTLYAECRAELQLDARENDELSLKGWYEANTGRSGELRLKHISEEVQEQRQ